MLIDDIALTMHPQLGARTAIHLMECFGSAEALFAATAEEIIERTQLRPSLARSISRREYHADAEREVVFAERKRLRIILSSSDHYPVRLKECPDYPHLLYVRGETNLNRPRVLSVVGTRKMTPYGRMACERLVRELRDVVPDLILVSGLAYGVDIMAHRAAMENSLATVAVLGHPMTRIFPAFHTDSARRMVESGGALVSEFYSTSAPGKMGFVQRNRVIAGLCDGVLVVESPDRGGSLITAEMADGYNRTVMAVPGRIGDETSEGTNRLIRTLRAQMVCSGEDIVKALNWDLEGSKQADLPFDVEFPEKIDRVRVSIIKESSPLETSTESVPFVRGESLKAEVGDTGFYSSVIGQEEVEREAVEKTRNRYPEGSTAARLLAMLDREEPKGLEELREEMELSLTELSLQLLDLEFSGAIRLLPGKRYIKK